MEHFCPQCGAPGWAYDGSQLKCDSCGNTRALAREARAIEAKELTTPPISPDTTGLGMEDVAAYACSSCEGIILAKHPLAGTCLNCGNDAEYVLQESVPEVQSPAFLLPFTVSEEAAKKKLKRWVNVNLLRPPGLAKGFDEVNLHGCYIPFWMYDVYAEATWKAKAGYLYFNRLQEDDPHKTGEPWEVRKIRYADTGGYYANTFQQMLIPVGKGGVVKHIESLIEDEELKELVPYDPRYLEYFEYAVQSDNPDKATSEAVKRINKQVEKAAGEEVDADMHRDIDVQLRLEGLSLQQVLLPVWVVTMKYRGKAYHACIHGRTGKIEGDQPWSPVRVGLLILMICGLIFASVVLFEKWML